MEREQKRDEFIRKIVRQQEPVKAPDGFADRVMGKLQTTGEIKTEPLLSPVIWIVIFLSAAALVTTMFLVDMPFINNLFSSSGIQKISMNIFTNQFYDSFLLAFKDIPFNATAAIILIAVLSLVIIERLISRKKSPQGMVML